MPKLLVSTLIEELKSKDHKLEEKLKEDMTKLEVVNLLRAFREQNIVARN